MKKLYRILILISWVSWLQTGAQPAVRPEVPEVRLPFPMGEILTYQIYWGWIAVGESKASTDWVWIEDESRWLIRIRFRTVSNGVVAKLYPVDDVVDTLVDPVTLKPVVHLQDLQEGRHVRKAQTWFDWENQVAVYTKKHEDKEDEVKTIPLEEGSRDLVSFMYFLRDMDFKEKTRYDFKVLSDYKMYDLQVNTAGTQKIHLDEYGKVESLKLNPEAEFEGVFVRKGKMELWLSNDHRQLLTKLQLDTPFANVKLLLKSVEGPGAGEWSKKEKK